MSSDPVNKVIGVTKAHLATLQPKLGQSEGSWDPLSDLPIDITRTGAILDMSRFPDDPTVLAT
jgi:hypothetical protein